MQNRLSNAAQFLAMEASYEDADVVVFGAPFDGTTSYRPGTRFAAQQMRCESDGIETYSPLLDLEYLIYVYIFELFLYFHDLTFLLYFLGLLHFLGDALQKNALAYGVKSLFLFLLLLLFS